MCWNLSNHHPNIDCYIHGTLYMNLMITTNQKPVNIQTQKRERNPGMTLKNVIKAQGKRTKEKTEELQKPPEHH